MASYTPNILPVFPGPPHDRLYDAVVDEVCEFGSLVSLKIVSREHFGRLVAAGNPLVANVLHDGVPLALN